MYGLQKINEANDKTLEETIKQGDDKEGKKGKKMGHEILDDGSIRVHTEEYLEIQNGSMTVENKENVCELKVRTIKNG